MIIAVAYLCCFELLFVRNRITFVNLRFTFCSANWKYLVYFLKVKPCLFEIFIENEDKIEVSEKPYKNTLAVYIFTKIEFCVTKHWWFNICSLKIQLITLFMKFFILFQLINHGSGFWGLNKYMQSY